VSADRRQRNAAPAGPDGSTAVPCPVNPGAGTGAP